MQLLPPQSDTPARALVLGAGAEQIPAIEAAQSAGLHVVALDRDEAAPGLRIADHGAPIDIASEDEVVSFATEYGPQLVVPAPLGPALTSVGAVNDALSLRGVTRDQCEIFVDKMRFHNHVEHAGLPHARLRHAETALEIAAAVHQLHLPCILKPTRGSGSRGVTVIPTDAVLAEGIDWHLSERPQGQGTIVEEFLEGREAGVDAIVRDEKVEVVLVRDKFITPLPWRQELGFSAPTTLESRTQAAIEAHLRRLISSIGICDGVLHADVLVCAGNEIVVIEAAPRPAGMHVSDLLVPAATGRDLLAESIDILLGRPVLDHRPRTIAAAQLCVLPFGAGVTPTDWARSVPARAEMTIVAGSAETPLDTPVQSTRDVLERGMFLCVGKNLNDVDQRRRRFIDDLPLGSSSDRAQYGELMA